MNIMNFAFVVGKLCETNEGVLKHFSQENTCTRVSFLMKLRARSLQLYRIDT